MKTNKPKTKIITGCNDCPFLFFDHDNDTAHCAIDKQEMDIELIDIKNVKTPKWCPLTVQPIIVTYES